MKLDYNKLITINDILKLTDEQLENLKKTANNELGIIKAKLTKDNRIPSMIARKANERIYLGSDYKYESNTNKGIIIANIAFPEINEEEKTRSKEKLFTEALHNKGFNIKILRNLLNRIHYIKTKKESNTFDINDEKIEKENLLYIKKITEIINGYFLEIAPETILNKIATILADFQRITNKVTSQKEIKQFFFNTENKNNKQIINCYFGCNLNSTSSDSQLSDVVINIYPIITELKSFGKRINSTINYTFVTTEQLQKIITNTEETKTMIKEEKKLETRKILEDTIQETDKKLIQDITEGCIIYTANPSYKKILKKEVK